jgi:hypothetical protein
MTTKPTHPTLTLRPAMTEAERAFLGAAPDAAETRAPRRPGPTTRRVAVLLPLDVADRLEAWAEANERPMTYAITKALDAWLAEQGR